MTYRYMLLVNMIMLYFDIHKFHVNIIVSRVDLIYLARKGQKYDNINYDGLQFIHVSMM